MLRMTPIASAVLLLLLGIDAHAAEETLIQIYDGWNER